MYSEREFSIWVSDLPSDISDEDFWKTFSTRYDSVVTAKLMREKARRGETEKVYGFVRFASMNDQREALIHMNGFVGIPGHPGKPIKVIVYLYTGSIHCYPRIKHFMRVYVSNSWPL